MMNDNKDEKDCDKHTRDENNTDNDNNVDSNVNSESNSIITTEFDESLVLINPIQKEYEKSIDNSSYNVEVNDNVGPSCSTPIVSKYLSKMKNRRYRKQSSDGYGDDDDDNDNDNDKEEKEKEDDDEDDNDDDVKDVEMSGKMQEIETHSVDPSDFSPDPARGTRNSSIDNEESSESDSDEAPLPQSDHSSEWTSASDDELEIPTVLKKNKPKPKWFIVPEIMNRQIGNNKYFDRNFYGSLHAVQRMKLLHKMHGHEGCVNALCFNETGKYLASASDDTKVIVWDWAREKNKNVYTTGHRLNIFDVKWLPLDFESFIVTCANDGHVRMIDTKSSTNRRLAGHHKEARGLAVHSDHPHGVLSVGADGKVLSIDIRAEKPTRLLTVKDRGSNIPLYTIHINPRNGNEFCVGGRSRSVKIYDRRRILDPVHDLCPHNLRQSQCVDVASIAYNYNGTEILASYSYNDIYLFDTALPHPSGDYAHHYEGHRNTITIKGVNFFGPRSEFIVSGSDCANIFIWEKDTEAIVQWMLGDNQGVVNRLESHPHAPILATSGLDCDVKIWVPSNHEEPKMPNLDTCIKTNMSNRGADGVLTDVFDSQVLSVVLHHVRQYGLYRGQEAMEGRMFSSNFFDNISESSNESGSSMNNNSEDTSFDDDSSDVPQCSPS